MWKTIIYIKYMRSRDRPHVQTNFAKQMTFKLPTTLANHLEQEIYEKLITAVELGAKEYNGKWAAREARGETFDTYEKIVGYNRTETRKVYYYNHHNLQFMNVMFAQKESDVFDDRFSKDYYRPISCTVNYELCRANAKAQRDHSVGLLESRVNGHLAVTDKITDINLELGKGYFIEGFVTGTTKDAEEFKIFTKMIWNYRYGANSANRYLTQYVQFRSDRRGARQEGKTVLQRATEAEIQAKKDAKKAEAIAKNEAKWERFAKLPDQIDRWADKQIKKHEKMLTEAGIQKAKDEFFSWYFNKGCEFDLEHHKTWVNRELTEARTYKERVQKFLNDEPAVRAMFGLDCNNRDAFMAKVWNS